ncbi:MAG: damage-control phosphatase ARMT1 family protein [bacterium]
MRTYLECIPCFFRQALEVAKTSGLDEAHQKVLIDEVAKLVPSFALSTSPPEKARLIYKIIHQITGERDPFYEIKERSNRLILDLYPQLKERVEKSDDRLLTAIELAIIGNIIDYGVSTYDEVEKGIKRLIHDCTMYSGEKAIFEYERFRSSLDRARMILYLADNAGEIVFDKLLIEELKSRGKEIIVAVKEEPVINDALTKDALDCGIDQYARIISSGMDAPGTILRMCSQSFLEHFYKADLIISKGQGNYETLNEVNAPLFFMFMVKCAIVAQHIGCNLYNIILQGSRSEEAV